MIDGKQDDGKFNKRMENCRLISEMNQLLAGIDKSGGEKQLKDMFFMINGYVSFIKNDEKCYYLACPDENVRKKVVLAQ